MATSQEKKYTAKEETASQTMSLKALFNTFVKYLPVFILSVLVCLFSMWLYLRYTTPFYSSVGKLMIKNEKGSSFSGEDLFQDVPFFSGSKNVDNEIEYIKSTTIASRVVTALGLEQSSFSKGSIKNYNLYRREPLRVQLLETKDTLNATVINIKMVSPNSFQVGNTNTVYTYGQKLQNTTGTFIVEKHATDIDFLYPTEIIVNIARFDDKVEELKKYLKVRQVNKLAEVVELIYESDNPQLAADVVNEYMRQYKMAILENKGQAASQTLNFIDERLQKVEGDLRQLESSLTEFKQRNNIIDLGEQSRQIVTSFQNYDKDYTKVKIEYDVISMLDDYMNDKRNQYNAVPFTRGLEDQTLVSLINNYNRLVLERDQQVRSTTPEHPKSILLTESVQLERKSLMEQIGRIKNAYGITSNSLKRKNDEILSKIATVPAVEKELIERERQREITNQLFTFLRKKREETAIMKAGTTVNADPIDIGKPGKYPVKPVKLFYYLLAAVIGALLPIIFIFLHSILNDKVLSKEDVSQVTQTPIIGSIIHTDEKKEGIVVNKGRKVVAEQFRIIRTNLFYFLTKSEKSVIMVTSSFSGEGKSFFSTNLAAIFAISGKKTVVLEFDLRKPKIASYLKLERGNKGISNYVVGRASVQDILIPYAEIENLHVVPCGDIPPNPAEMLLHPKIGELFAYLKANFDVVVIDTAPVGLVSDAFHLSEFADATIYMVRHGYTHKPQLEMLDELYKNQKLPGLSIVINDIKANRMPYYGNHNYGYGQGYYGTEDVIPWYKKIFRIFSSN
jgi:tyrosine-protein kinase Etk/Wzc